MISELPTWLPITFTFLFGLIIGSFANVCICRLPLDESVVWPPSACRSCGRRLAFWENIPVLSYIFLRGRCRTCKSKISIVYPIVELLVGAFSVFTWLKFGTLGEYFAYFLLLVAPLIIVSFIDIKHLIIPDVISISGIFAGFLVHVIFTKTTYLSSAIDSLIGILVGGGFLFVIAYAYEKIKKQEGLGGGDVKLAAMLGAFFGWKAAIFILLLSSVVGTIVGLIIILVSHKNLKLAIPYGPFLSAGGLLYLFWGQQILAWYLGLFFK